MRSSSAIVLILGSTALLPAAIALAQDERPAAPDDRRAAAPSAEERMRQHRRRIEEGERASRAAPPAARPPSVADGPTAQLPLAARQGGAFSKESSVAAPAPPPSPPPPARLPGGLTGRYHIPADVVAALLTPPPPCFNHPRTASLMRAFPEVSWHVCVRDAGRKGLWVGPVHIRRTASGPWMTVLYEAGLADIFVPYHQINFRPYDLRWTSGLTQVGPQDIGSNGSLVWLSGESIPTVVAETRDRGIGWLCKQTTAPTRRVQEFVVWGVIDGGNYDNIVEFGFRDDGAMTFRMGNTGYNSPSDPVEPHTHNALWRVDMDLNGASGDSANWLTHGEPAPTVALPYARDIRTPFDVEGARRWNDSEDASLLIEDNSANAFGNRLGYRFMPMESMASRHYGAGELWTQNDVYVTRFSGNELSWMGPLNFPNAPWQAPDDYLLTYLNGQSVNNQDLVIWVKSAVDHHPTDEDRSNADLGTGNTTGVTLAHWSGFRIEPYNLFNANPLGGPARCGL